MKGRSFKLLALLAIIALTLGATGAAFAAPPADQPEHLKIDVCHATGSESNPYVLVNVNINSVEDAQNVGGHGTHEGDSWEPYTYGGVEYPGQGDMANCDDQEPQTASVSVNVGQCYWDGASYTDVALTMTGEGTFTLTGPGGPYVRTGSDSLTLGPGSYSWTFVPAEDFELEGPGSGEFVLGECEPETDPASVSLELGSCRWSEQGGSLTPLSITISGEGTLTLDGEEYTESDEILLPPGTYDWSFVPAEGYHLDGPGSGSFEVLSCEPPPPGGASGSFTLYCGGGINVVLSHARLTIDDLDPIYENGSYGLSLGDHTYFWEHEGDFEFPEGFLTRGVFTIVKCGPPDEPPTGPEGALPIAEGLAFLAFSGLGALGIRRMKKH